MTTSCHGNAFEACALDQSDACRALGAANQREASEDLNQDAGPCDSIVAFSITDHCVSLEVTRCLKWLFE